MTIINELSEVVSYTKKVDGFDLKGIKYTFEIESISVGGGSENEAPLERIRFCPPLKIEAFKKDGRARFEWKFDFGMELTSRDSEPGSYGVAVTADWKEKVKANVSYDVYHAFFHTAMDPNYVYRHYAILGCSSLNNRALALQSDGTEKPVTGVP